MLMRPMQPAWTSREETMLLPRPCLTCETSASPGRSRCRQCLLTVRRLWTRSSNERKRQRLATRGAAHHLRRAINRDGSATCELCGSMYPSRFIEVDHRRDLQHGGKDTPENVRPLCKACHFTKAHSPFL
ncbi:MAG: hypothetical protein CL407_03360 [Acidimicrobiaceae bacterium]|nr:hypothetical protein [Acidimicrobiaceae bacterium]